MPVNRNFAACHRDPAQEIHLEIWPEVSSLLGILKI